MFQPAGVLLVLTEREKEHVGVRDRGSGQATVNMMWTVLTNSCKNRGRAQGNIIVRFKEVNASKDEVTLQFKASNLDKKDFFGKSDPFLRLHRVNDDQSHDFIGAFSTTLNELSRGAVEANIFPVINPKKQAKKKNYKDSGQIQVLRCTIQQHQSFLDYIKGGLQMQFMVAIDFTASNGNPTHPSSLHYIHPQQPNQYVAAIKAIGEIIQDYNSKKMFPVLGFGAKLPDGQVSHDFAVNFNPQNPCVQGVDGILQAYQAALSRIQLHSPTNFSPVINLLSRYASEARDGSTYFTLLIITDGEITDMQQTKNAIVMASSLPMSIIIVGVGNAEFDAMEILDSDNCLLTDSNGRGAERDIVQFVPFRDFLGGRFGNNIESSKAALAKEVLAKIPDQVLEYMRNYFLVQLVARTFINIFQQLTTCTLNPATQALIELIFDKDMFEDAMRRFDIDLNKMSFEKLNRKDIEKGFKILDKLKEALERKDTLEELSILSSEFYDVIPRNFGTRKKPVINNTVFFQKEYDTLGDLEDIQIAQSILNEKPEQQARQIRGLIIERYFNETKPTNSWQNLVLQEIWKVDREGEEERFLAHDGIMDRKLLWYGTDMALVAAILKNGFCIKTHSSGRGGRSIHFVSESDKSSGYVRPFGNKGLMFLTEVAIGKQWKIYKESRNLMHPPEGYDSVLACGIQEPDPAFDTVITLDGKQVVVPQAKPRPTGNHSVFYQSEYLIYKESQTRIRYLLLIDF
ncbi:hypothetical protein C0Q70_14909 [Pomacea canaliculata]|uniref:Poly [ADP-ribose] polymerase n=1 Tax=Pomacea canaliculata TaxID=400727 RepID=A0A2T7NTF9_POMCA|nr:hypothetical protein C0Q70_14909 [Pomacea canaliculata]